MPWNPWMYWLAIVQVCGHTLLTSSQQNSALACFTCCPNVWYEKLGKAMVYTRNSKPRWAPPPPLCPNLSSKENTAYKGPKAIFKQQGCLNYWYSHLPTGTLSTLLCLAALFPWSCFLMYGIVLSDLMPTRVGLKSTTTYAITLGLLPWRTIHPANPSWVMVALNVTPCSTLNCSVCKHRFLIEAEQVRDVPTNQPMRPFRSLLSTLSGRNCPGSQVKVCHITSPLRIFFFLN